MPRWYDGAEESAFKPVAGGYVAQLPSSGLIGRPRYYLVNDAQKAEIAAVLRRERRWMLGLLAIFFLTLAAFGAGLAVGIAHGHGGRVLSGLSIGIGASLLVLVMIGTFAWLHAHVMRPLQPLLATLPPTDERIKFSEQIRALARAVSGKVLVVGIASGIVMIIASSLTVAGVVYEGRSGFTLVWASVMFVWGGLLTAYFAWLITVRKRLNRNSA
jgi:hypothetical protein